MAFKTLSLLIIVTIILSLGSYFVYSNFIASPSPDIVCPVDGSPFIWTPIESRSENFLWRCLQHDHQWTRSYSDTVYQAWLNAPFDPLFVRDYTLLYLKTILELDLHDPLTLEWTGGRVTPDGTLGYETYVYTADSVNITIGYPVVSPENTIYELTVKVDGSVVWKGRLHQRQFLQSSPHYTDNLASIYEFYGGVGIFTRGIHVTATDGNPTDCTSGYNLVNEYWQMLKQKVTQTASVDDYISIIISRGDKPTGGYTLQVKQFSWLESYPVKLRFTVNFTDPGDGVAVTEAFTNPLVLLPLGKLDPGEYHIEVHIDAYILTYDENGNPIYTQLKTFKEEIWTLPFTILPRP